MLPLPAPRHTGKLSIEETLLKRRSVRRFQDRELTQEQLSQLLWAADGNSRDAGGLRTAPSAGAVYPIELYPVTSQGVFHYLSVSHSLEPLLEGDLRSSLGAAAFGQRFIAAAPLTIVLCAGYFKIQEQYGKQGIRYADMEAGHIAQNIHLQAAALGLGSVPVGAFNAVALRELFHLPESLEPIYLIPVGYQDDTSG